VEVTIEQAGVVTGRDRGIAWVQNNAVCFTGHRSSFVVDGQDLVGYGEALPAPKFMKEPLFSLHLRGTGFPLRVTLEALKGPGLRESNAHFFQALASFHEQRPRTAMRRQMPPLSLDPRLPRNSFLGAITLAVAAGPLSWWLLLGPDWWARVVAGLTYNDFMNGFLGLGMFAWCLKPLNNRLEARKVRRLIAREHLPSSVEERGALPAEPAGADPQAGTADISSDHRTNA